MNLNLTMVNGEKTDLISVNDRGFLYGDGVFETILVKNSKPCYLPEHLERLYSSCDRLQIRAPDKKILQDEISELVHGVDKAALKLIITRGEASSGFKLLSSKSNRIIKLSNYPPGVDKNIKNGMRVKICATRLTANPATSGMKLLNWLEPALANLELGDEYEEGLMLNSKSYIVEGTTSNFFGVNDSKLITPDLSECGLPGIMRAKIIEIAPELGLEVVISKINLEDLNNFTAAFTSNSLGVYPVLSIGDIEYPKHEVCRLLTNELV